MLLKQIFLTQFNENFLRPISDCDSSLVRLNGLNDLEEIVLLLCMTKVWPLEAFVSCLRQVTSKISASLQESQLIGYDCKTQMIREQIRQNYYHCFYAAI